MPDKDDSGELRREQATRETEELKRLQESELPDEARQHRRRADKAGYLRQKLEERERAERRAAEED